MTSSSAPRMVNSYKRTSSPRSPTNSGELFTPAHEENVRFIHDSKYCVLQFCIKIIYIYFYLGTKVESHCPRKILVGPSCNILTFTKTSSGSKAPFEILNVSICIFLSVSFFFFFTG
uniref:Uncharacterized protein n=1 Tax=Poecilia mexicana TaxID=48701 RepID=A0A3B3WIB7_9TELE